jgi:general secretion pathway protein I
MSTYGSQPVRAVAPFIASAGFTLLEVMAALAILSIVMTSIYRLHSQTVVMHQRARFYITAPFLAQQKLSELETAKLSDLKGEDKGDFGEDFSGYTWELKTEDVESEDLGETANRLKKVQIIVTLNDGEFTFTLNTCRFISG